MTTDEQLAAIRVPQFFTDLRTAMQAVKAAMVADGFTIQGQVTLTVDGVPVIAEFVSATDVEVRVGQDDKGQPLYQWHAPVAWVS